MATHENRTARRAIISLIGALAKFYGEGSHPGLFTWVETEREMLYKLKDLVNQLYK